MNKVDNRFFKKHIGRDIKLQISNFEWPEQGRIKHYYNGSQRLASRIGGGFATHPDLNHYDPLTDHVELPHSGDYHHKALALVELWTRQAECAGLQPSLEFSYSLAEGNLHNPLSEPADGERYFYHSDHLGSSAFITTENGYATQFLAYLPFGETLNEEQNSSNYYSPFKFSAKEKDPETGYSYFGARYYSPELSVWLSVDPLADHPNQVDKSPYAAFWNNPVKYNDPDGRCPKCEEEMPDAPMNTVYRPEGSSLDWVKGADGQWTGIGGDLNEVLVTASPLPSGEARDAQGGGNTLGNVDLGNGNVVNVHFANTKDGVNSNLPVSPSLVKAFNGAVKVASQSYNITSITISATTNGAHGPNSRHYAGNALDISMVNGIAVGPSQPVIGALQDAFELQPGRRENFGPALMMKLGQPYIHGGLSPSLYQQRKRIRNAHFNHIHWSVN